MGIFTLFIITIVLTYFVYLDSQKRGVKHEYIWVILSLFIPIIGFIIYIAIRPKEIVNNTPNKIPYGFRSKKPYKIVIASLAYLFILIVTFSAATAPPIDSSQSNKTGSITESKKDSTQSPTSNKQTLQLDNGKFEGSIVNGQKEGDGKYNWSNGDVYTGQWKNNQMNSGIVKYSNGDSFDGNFINNKKDGYGSFTWENGDKYQGYWKNDMMNGTGTYTFKNGDIYEGNWVDNKMNGQGKYTFTDGTVLDGTWQNNTFVK